MRVSNEDIISFLKQYSDWQSGIIMATQFGVSRRTIRNRIQDINKDKKRIESSPLGYRLLNESSASSTFQSEKLEDQIFATLFTSVSNKMAITELLEKLFYSESTIRSAITKFNKINKQSGVRIKIQDGLIFITGEEYNRRLIFHKYVGEKLRSSDYKGSILNLQKLIPMIPLSDLQDIIASVVSKQDLVINGYELNDLLLHYSISINRIKNGKKYKKSVSNKETKRFMQRSEYSITKEITKKIGMSYGLNFNEYEIEELTLALIGKTISKGTGEQNLDNLKEFVPDYIIETCLTVIDEVNEEYGLQLKNDNFLVRFIIHVNNIVDRAKLKNDYPSNEFDYLEKVYPFMHELALYILERLSEKLDMKLNSEESIYLLLHLGTYMEDNVKHKINTVIVTPEYYDSAKVITRKVKETFYEQLQISQVISKLNKTTDINSSLVLTTFDVPVPSNNYVVKISPLVSSFDVNKIKNEISKIYHDLKVKFIQECLYKYTDSRLFFTDTNFVDKEECLCFGARQLQKLNYVDNEFLQELVRRENMAATNYGNVAVPHTLKMQANSTGIVVMMNQNNLQWSENSAEGVQLIFMIAINKQDTRIFNELLQSIISIVSIEGNVKKLLSVEDYQDFMQMMEHLLDQDLELS